MNDGVHLVIIDAPLRESHEELLAHLGVENKERAGEAPLSDVAGEWECIAVAEHNGKTIIGGDDALELWITGWDELCKDLVERFDATRVACIWTTTTGHFAYVIMERDGSGVMRLGGSDKEFATEMGSAKETGFHPWEIEYLGTADPPRDDYGRPMKGRTEFPHWGPGFAHEVIRRMLEEPEWSSIPMTRYTPPGDPHAETGAPKSQGGCLVFVAAALTLALLALG
ncbi:MAG: hypothetical protein OER88_05680 [Planctomycetota bacterium]|nr:hypothetical protein [Planctomycetota bacterium]